MSRIAPQGVMHIITSLDDGGAENALFRLCTRDNQNRHHVVSLTGMGKYGPLLERQGILVSALEMPRGRVTVSGLWRLWKLLRRERPAALQTWMYHADLLGGVIARLAGTHNVLWGVRHSDLTDGGTSRSTIAVARVCAWLSRVVPRRIIYCAANAAQVHTALGYDARRGRIIPNGYDLFAFKPDVEAGTSLRASLGLSAKESVVGFVARYDPLKDHRNLLNALRQLKDRGYTPACLLVGTGTDESNAELSAQVSTLGLARQVYMLGPRDDIPAVMNALDLHVMSSASEAFPNVLAEAMACGRPCVTTDVGDAAEIVGETGWIVARRDSRALGNAIADALENMHSAAWTQRQKDARSRIETLFSIETMVGRYQSAWFEK